MTTSLLAIVLVVAGTLISAISPVWLKKASSKKFDLKSVFTNYYLFGAVALYIIGLIVFIIALRIGDLSVLYPLASLSYVWANILSAKLLGERMNFQKWMAVALIICGAFFIGIGS